MKKLRVWWNPQVGIQNAFYIPVKDEVEAKKTMDLLGAYDAFLLENGIRGDYCNVCGLEMYDEESDEWEDWYLETEDDYFDNLDEYVDECLASEEAAKFSEEMYKQIDWDNLNNMGGI